MQLKLLTFLNEMLVSYRSQFYV